MFDGLDAEADTALDAHACMKKTVLFKSASNSLCIALASIGRLSAFVLCCVIPPDKCLGVRPVGVGEVPRGIVYTLRIISGDVEEAAGPLCRPRCWL